MPRGYPDYEGGKVGLYPEPEWAAKEGNSKHFLKYAYNQASGGTATESHIVPAGKTLYLTEASFAIWATNADDRDNNQMGILDIIDFITGNHRATIGGNGGGFVQWRLPKKIDGPLDIRFILTNEAYHNCNLLFIVSGYEIDT